MTVSNIMEACRTQAGGVIPNPTGYKVNTTKNRHGLLTKHSSWSRKSKV